MKEKCIVLLSGGLDSRLAVKIMQEKGFEVTALFFKLPFSKDNSSEIKKFCKEEKVGLKIFDCTKGKLLKKYLEVIKNAKFGRGAGINPCVDCKIFMLKKAKEFADKNKIKFIATGEVKGQRPMSQMKKSLKLIEEKSGLIGKIIRPLSELGIIGRQRTKQIELARKFKIDFPPPAGGCILCEKELKKRFESLIKKDMINEKNLNLACIGRHFINGKKWIVLGKNKKENEIIESQKGIKIIPKQPGPSAWIRGKESVNKAKKLIQQHSKHKIKEFDIKK